MADQIAGEQARIILAQIPAQAVYLAGSSGEQDRCIRLQESFDRWKYPGQIALDIFGAAHGGERLRRTGAEVAGSVSILQNTAEHGAPLLQNVSCQRREHAAGRAGLTDSLILIPDSEGGQRAVRGGGRQRGQTGTDRLTPAAQHAGVADPGPEEALMVGDHGDGSHGTDSGAGSAAGAGLPGAEDGAAGGRLWRRLGGELGTLQGGLEIGQV